jgi:predicted nucleic acid-binding protein
MGAIALDADVLIGFLYGADPQHQEAVALLSPRLEAGDRVLVAASVYAEALIHPIRRGRGDVVDQFLNAVPARIVPIDRGVARRAAELRASHRSLRLPDALSLATALETKSLFLTLDKNLRALSARLAPS